MLHDSHPESSDLEQRPALAGSAWVFDMLAEGGSLLPLDPQQRDEDDHPGPVTITLILIALLFVIIAIVQLF
jgi:hypothetical protein